MDDGRDCDRGKECIGHKCGIKLPDPNNFTNTVCCPEMMTNCEVVDYPKCRIEFYLCKGFDLPNGSPCYFGFDDMCKSSSFCEQSIDSFDTTVNLDVGLCKEKVRVLLNIV